MDNEAERIRIKYLYRSLVMKGKIRLCPDAARRIVGPDCAYHLYAQIGAVGEDQPNAQSPKKNRKNAARTVE